VIDNGIAAHENDCEIKSSWGAAICQGDMGRFSIDDTREFPEFGTRPITNPIILVRDGRRFEYNGEITIGSGAEIRVDTARDKLALSLREMDQGSFVIFQLPGFTTTAAGAEKPSLEDLREASETAWFRDADSLWVKLVVEDPAADGPVVVQVGNLRAQASIEVGREGLGG
jgi:hypothetical protein